MGTDRAGLVHTLVTTDAGAADITRLPQLLHGAKRELYGDQAYCSEMHRLAAKELGVRYRVNRRAVPGRRLTEHQRRLNRLRSATRARGGHAFRVVKQLWGYSKGPLPGPGEEHGPTVHDVHDGQPVCAPTTAVAHIGKVSVRTAENHSTTRETAPKGHFRLVPRP